MKSSLNFSDEQRAATERAGLLAGLSKVKLLKEPEAAALAYGLLQKQQQMVLVFDLGGGTFDVSVLEVGGGFVEVIATSGDGQLGGDDFDNVIIDWMINQFSKISCEGSKFIMKDAISLKRLKVEAVKVKLQLSQTSNASVNISNLYNGLGLVDSLSRKQFEQLSRTLFDRLLKPLREVSLMAGINLPGESGQVGTFQSEIDIIDDIVPIDGDASQRNLQIKGRANAKEKNKAKGNSKRELRRLQKEYSDPSLSLFPGGQALDDVVLVGGATRMPAIIRLVKIMTGIGIIYYFYIFTNYYRSSQKRQS